MKKTTISILILVIGFISLLFAIISRELIEILAAFSYILFAVFFYFYIKNESDKKFSYLSLAFLSVFLILTGFKFLSRLNLL